MTEKFRLLVVLPFSLFAYGEYDAQRSCELFIAPSTIPGAGLGLFTATAKRENDTVGNGDIALPLIATELNSGAPYFHHDIFQHYVWSGVGTGMGLEFPGDFINTYWPGIDCAINSHLALNNVFGAQPYLDENMYRSNMESPSAGSMSPFRNGTSVVARPIPAGGELFKNYGDQWFISRESIFGKLPLPGDYPLAQNLLSKFDRLSRRISLDKSFLYELMLDINVDWNSRVLLALPPSLDDADKAVKEGIESLHQPNATRSLDDLYENGKCIDHIIAGPSTIKDAGQGAFAKRRLPKGTVISGSPLLHVINPTLFDMYDFDRETFPSDPYSWTRKEMIGRQIVLNYCLGNHHLTDVVLCPYGSGINYINHDRSRANVRIQWAAHGSTGQNDEWLDIPPDQLENKPKLAIDYVATKDIAEGEELFLDYGDDWINAWESHVASWKPPTRPKDDATVWNERREPIRTMKEQTLNPYPGHLMLRCHSFLVNHNFDAILEKTGWSWNRTDRDEMLKYGMVYGNPCEILARNDTDDTYTVYMFADHLNMVELPSNFIEQPIREMVPRDAIYFVDVGTSDYLMKGVFRHPIGLPDDMVPHAWRRKDDDDDGTSESSSSSKSEL